MTDEETTGTVRYEVSGHIARITIDHVAKMNAVTSTMADQLLAAYDRVQHDDNVRVAIVTGAGDRAFCAGGYMPAYVEGGIVGAGTTGKHHEVPKPWRIWKPFIAAIRGYCLAGGFGLALSCDLRIASPDAVFCATGNKRGVVPGGQQIQRLIRLVPFSKALELVLMARNITADEAESIGLVNKVVAASSVIDVAQKWAEVLAAYSPQAVQATKEVAYRGFSMSLDDAFDYERRAMEASFRTEDAREGFQAFLERRNPAFLGR